MGKTNMLGEFQFRFYHQTMCMKLNLVFLFKNKYIIAPESIYVKNLNKINNFIREFLLLVIKGEAIL